MAFDFENEERLRKKAMSLPLQPGVYIMHDSSGKIIYVGKAKALRNRVSQYFGSHRGHGEKVIKMVSNVEDFEYIVCDSEYEALMLECSLIKKHQPKYNILLKDDKGYHYIRVGGSGWPRLSAAMQLEDDGADYIGPYYSSAAVRQAVEAACRIFMLPTCSRTLGEGRGSCRPCLNYYIKNCSAPCCSMISEKEYRRSVEDAVSFIKNGVGEALAELRRQMNEAAESMQFERAAVLRDRIAAVKKLGERQKVVSSSYKQQDVIASANDGKTVCFEVFIFRNGDLSDRREYAFEMTDGIGATYGEFITAYYSENTPPSRIVTDRPPDDTELTERMLSELAGRRVELFVPQRGEQLKLCEMCAKNAAERLARELGHSGSGTAALEELRALLGLNKAPVRIESYDISNTAGSENVAGMVVFKNGAPQKSEYRKFKIKGFSGQDDYRSMAEVLDRRLSEYEASDSDSGFGELPDLILLDGGKGQVAAVREVLAAHGIDIPLFGMVKDSKHRTRAITAGGEDIEIKASRRVYTLVSSIQEEVHRFAISFHRRARSSAAVSSELDSIKGVGKARTAILIKHFGSVSAIASADREQLISAGIDRRTADSIYGHFHPDRSENE